MCAQCLLSSHWAPLRRLWLHFLYSFSSVITHTFDPSFLSLSLCDRCFNTLITVIVLPWILSSPCPASTGLSSTGPSTTGVASPALSRWERSPPPTGNPLPDKKTIRLCHTRAHCCLRANLESTRSPGSSQKSCVHSLSLAVWQSRSSGSFLAVRGL